MASQGVTANSRLAEMQMRFQKKQMLEREQKKLAMTGGVTTTSDSSIPSKTTIGNGKVRQMFDDRRRGVGIDRSHPLRPIVSSTNSTSGTARTSMQQTSTNSRLTGAANISKRPVVANSTLKKSHNTPTTHTNLNNSYPTNNDRGSSGNIFNNNLDELDNLENETFPKEFSSLSLNETHIMGSRITTDRDFNGNSNDESSILGGTIVINNKKASPKANGIKLNPVITKKSPTATIVKTNVLYNKTAGNANKVSPSKSPTSTVRTPLQKTTTPQTVKGVKNSGTKTSNNVKPATFALSVKPPPRISTPPPGMAACQFCQRHFLEERLSKHEEVCRKMTSKKRKIFDASKHRVKGTEAEVYLRKGKGAVSAPKQTHVATKTQGSDEKKSNWRKKHEEFIAAIREAKKVQAYLAKGGKLSDLPPPPPSENPDYVQCPHCGRRFNESAASRHIPKCANMQHNKPKPHGSNTQRKR